MWDKGYFDFELRKGKCFGGYNMLLYFFGIFFIFMNVMNLLNDMWILMYESGYVIYFLLIYDYELSLVKWVFFEVVELVVMMMELLSMDYWDIFFENEDDFCRVKIG